MTTDPINVVRYVQKDGLTSCCGAYSKFGDFGDGQREYCRVCFHDVVDLSLVPPTVFALPGDKS